MNYQSGIMNKTSKKRRALNKTSPNDAFTLVEVLVSVSIFAIVMLVATGAVFTIVESNKKTHTLKSVMTNLNFALESMARDMRVGFSYRCNGVGDCTSGGTTFIYKANRDVDGDGFYNAGDGNDQIEYTTSSGRIMKRIYSNGQSAVPVTASEIYIESMKFYLFGSGASDGQQPKVLITIDGYAGIGQTRSDFNIQTTVSQRAIDS